MALSQRDLEVIRSAPVEQLRLNRQRLLDMGGPKSADQAQFLREVNTQILRRSEPSAPRAATATAARTAGS